MVHLYNRWLPPPVADEVGVESERFHALVEIIQQTSQNSSLSSRLSSLKWISVVKTFLKAQSTLAMVDVRDLVEATLCIILISSDNLYIQTRWANCLARLLSKYRKELKLDIEWRPLYNLILNTHFKRRSSYEGLRLKSSHLANFIYLTEACRRFFRPDSATEIWFEFKPKFGDISHNSALEAAGFVCLLLPTKAQKKAGMDGSFFTRTWLAECLELWSAIPSCYYWNVQWASLLSRCIKHRVLDPSDWELFLPKLFTNFLNAFDVPVGRAGAWAPVHRRIPSGIKHAFSSLSPGLSTLTAKSIVYLLSPCGSAQVHFNTMIDFLEQYYHPSNGGSWTGPLQRFLRYLVFYFLQRLAHEHREKPKCGGIVEDPFSLGPSQRKAFVTSVMKLIDRGQYSKDAALAQSAASAASRLSYIEPSIMLPLVISRFHSALETITATHQLQSALRMLALSARALLLHDPSAADKSLVASRISLSQAMFSTLPGLDANDPPKTLATMQLYCVVLSSIGKLDDEGDFKSKILPINWSLWVDEFLDHLFALLVNLEPSVLSSNDVASGNGFLTESESMYSYLMDLLFAKMTVLQYNQVLKRTVKFVSGNILPGAIEEVGLLCSCVVRANPTEANTQLLAPIMNSLLLSLEDSPTTGFSGSLEQTTLVDFKVGMSPALELTTRYHLSVLSKAVFNGGSALLVHKLLLQQVISAAFDAPSSKVNDAGSDLLISTIGSMLWYYPVNSVKASSFCISSEGFEEWISTKSNSLSGEQWLPSQWHIPESEELIFVNDIVDFHLRSALASLKKICKEGYKSKYSGQEKENLRVLLLRIEGVLCGLGSCLPDFCPPDDSLKSSGGEKGFPLAIVGAAGATVTTSKLREETAEIIHELCEYVLKNKSDDYILMKKIISVMDMVGNYGSIEYYSYQHMKVSWDDNSYLLAEPCTNFINKSFSKTKRRPWWFVVERVFVQSMWRASQAGYRCYNSKGTGLSVPTHVSTLCKDLLRLSLHSYSNVRLAAGRNLKNILRRYPTLVQDCMPLLTKSLLDPKATKESALGSCEMLISAPVMRHLRQDWNALVSFLVALLGSAHHESVEAQAAINELFVTFNTSFGGIPAKAFSNSGDNNSPESMTYSNLVFYVRNLLNDHSITIHWRYNLMAHGMLLLLVLPVSYHEKHLDKCIVSNLRYAVAGGFLNNLKSELPLLRPFSGIALLFLLEVLHRNEDKSDCPGRFSIEGGCQSEEMPYSYESSMENVLHDGKFGESIVDKLANDRQSVEGDGFAPQSTSDAGLTSFMPASMREWPHTSTWDTNMEGKKFSPTFAKLCERLVQEFGSTVLNQFHGPLEEASGATEDQGKLCIAAEILAGFLHSDADCVIAEWDEWICPLLLKYLSLPTLDSAPEWAACIRFAVGGKGRMGSRMPALCQKILKCLVKPLPKRTSTAFIAKRFMFLRAALLELLPVYSSAEEISFQKDLLNEVLYLLAHPSPQVRKSVGSMLCLLLSNLCLFSKIKRENNYLHGEEDEAEGTCFVLINNSMDATKMIVNANLSTFDTAVSRNKGEGFSTKPYKEYVQQMETMLYFLTATIRSGRANTLMNTVVGLIYPTLSLQETSEKDLSALARSGLRFLQWQLFPVSHLPQVIEVSLTAANDRNWHTRLALLTFLQPFLFRHKFILSTVEVKSLWDKVASLILDPQLEVREAAATTLSGMMKGEEATFAKPFRQEIAEKAHLLKKTGKGKRTNDGLIQSAPNVHGVVLGLSAVISSVPYDMPRWLPGMVTLLAEFANEPWPIRGTVTKTIGRFRHTHSDMWDFQKDAFTEQQLEVLLNSTSSATYFA